MAFMTPLVKKRYDIYEHTANVTVKSSSAPVDSSTLHQKSLKLVNKLFRLVVDKSKNAERKPSPGLGAVVVPVPKPKVPSPPASKAKSQTAPVSIKPKSQTQAISIPKSPASIQSKSPSSPQSLKVPTATSPSTSPKSPQSISPPSRPIPHIRRTMRDSATNRVYSYSVSIPDYVLEESEEDLEEEEAETFSSSAPLQFEYENSSHLAAPH